MGDAVGADDDAGRLRALGPRGRDLAVEQTGIDAGKHIFDVSVPQDRSGRDCARRLCAGCNGCRGRGFLLRHQGFGMRHNAFSGCRHDRGRDLSGCLEVISGPVGLRDHGQVHACHDRPSGMVRAEQEDLVVGCSRKQITHEQHILRITQFCNRLLELGAQVIRRLAVVERHRDHIVRFAEYHAGGGIDSRCEVAMTCKDNSNHS